MKLQAKDLMIGDWIKFTDGNKKCTVVGAKCDARYLEEEAIITVMDDSGHWFDKELECLQPIPLTAEILEKNGFAKVVEIEHDCTYRLLIPTSYKETPYSIQFTFCNDPTSAVNTIFNCWGPISSEGRGVNDIHMCNIESVHELQHTLKLCGIEKTIEL